MGKLHRMLRLTVSALLISSVLSLVWISTRLFTDDNTNLIQQMNEDKAAALSTELREQLENLTDKMRILGSILTQEGNKGARPEFFAKDRNFLALFVYRGDDSGKFAPLAQALSPEISPADPDGTKLLALLGEEKSLSLPEVSKGDVQIDTLRLPDSSEAIALGVPFLENPAKPGEFTHLLVALVRQNKLAKTFSESALSTTYLVDRKGKLLAHPDATRVAARENVAHLEIVKLLLDGKTDHQQARYVDPSTHESRLGAFRRVGFGGLGVVAEVAESKAFETAQRARYRSMPIALILLCVSFLAGYLYSSMITRPIQQTAFQETVLVEAPATTEAQPEIVASMTENPEAVPVLAVETTAPASAVISAPPLLPPPPLKRPYLLSRMAAPSPPEPVEQEPSVAVAIQEPTVIAAGPLSEQDWFVKLGEDTLGPFTREEIIQGIRQQDFPGDVLVRAPNTALWKSAVEIQELQQPPILEAIDYAS